MFREGEQPKEKTNVNILIADGGMGDLLCALVPVNYILSTVNWIRPIIYVPDYLLDFSRNVLPKHADIRNYTEAKTRYNEKFPGLTTQWKSQHTPMRTHPIDYSYRMLTDGDGKDKNYLKFNNTDNTFNLPEKYVVLSVGAAAKTKELPNDVLNDITDYVKSKGHTPIFLGKEKSNSGVGDKGIVASMSDIDYSKGINLVNKTNLCEAASVISQAKAFIGMEGGLTHLAAFTDVPIIAGYTFVSPEVMMPTRNNEKGYKVYPVVPEVSLACRYCQSNIPLLYGHDFRNCIYEDYLCVQQLTFEKFKEQIDKVLNE